MPESTAKKNLLAEQQLTITPTKRPVRCQLNGWLQTYHKQQLNLKKCCPTFRSRKNYQQVYETPTSLGQLKARKQQLMRSSFKKPLLFIDKEKTRPDSRSGHTGKTTRRRTVNMRQKVPLSRVNEFIADENQRNNNMVSLIPSTMPFRNRNLKGSMRSKNGKTDKEDKKEKQVSQRHQKRKGLTENDEEREKALAVLKERIRQQNKLQLLKRKTSNILINFSRKNN